MASYFEITISSRQLALVIAGVVALVLVAFGLGVGVGLQQSPPAAPAQNLIAVAPEPSFAPSVPAEPPPPVVDPTVLPPATAAILPTPTPEPTPEAAVEPTLPPPVVRQPPPSATSPVQAEAETPLARLARGQWVQVGALAQDASAQALRRQVLQLGFPPTQVAVQVGEDGKHRVRVGPFPDEESAGRVAARLRASGFPGAFVVKE